MPLNEYEPGSAFSGTIGRTTDESTPAWPKPVRAVPGAPNVLIIVLDDTGYGRGLAQLYEPKRQGPDQCAGLRTRASSPPASAPASSLTEVGYYLADFNTVQTYGINVESTPRKVNGVMYDHPVAWYASGRGDDPYWAEWDLSRECTWLTFSWRRDLGRSAVGLALHLLRPNGWLGQVAKDDQSRSVARRKGFG